MPDEEPEATGLLLVEQDETTGRIEYNDYEFPVARKTQWSCKDVYDEAGRTVKWVEWHLIVSFFLIGASRTDSDNKVEEVRRKLNEPGKRLKVEGLGLGRIDVGKGLDTPDLEWGPKPQGLTFSPMGGNTCYMVTWEVTFAISECLIGQPSSLQPSVMAFAAANYDVEFTADEQGAQTRTITGFVEVPQVRDGRRSGINIDAVRDRIKVEVPQGYKRVSGSTKINAARTRVSFSFVDTEVLAESYPPGISYAEIEYNFRTNEDYNTSSWMASLGGVIETAPGVPLEEAARLFMLMLRDKAKLSAASPKSATVLRSASIGRRAFSRQTSFSFSWLVTGDMMSLLERAGIWEPVAGSNYQQWRTSMARLWSTRGRSGIGLDQNEDVVIDLCQTKNQFQIGRTNTYPVQALRDWRSPFDCSQYTKENSWIAYHNDLAAIAEGKQILHTLYPDNATPTDPTKDDGRGKPGAGAELDPPNPQNIPATILQMWDDLGHRAVVMHGKAARVKFPVDVPALKYIGDTRMIEVARNVRSGYLSVIHDCDILFARWSIMYLPYDVVKDLGLLKNLEARTKGQKTRQGDD